MGRDTITLEQAVSIISQEYLQLFCSDYFIPESLHPELPGPEDAIVNFPEGKIGVYCKFFEFANYRIPITQFLFDLLGHYQIHLSQLSVIGAAKVSQFEINCRVLNVIPTVDLFRVFYIPSYQSGWMSFAKRPGKDTPQCYVKPLDSLKNWNNRFFWVDERVFPTPVAWRSSAPRDNKPTADSYSEADVATLNTHRTSFGQQPEDLLCLVGIMMDLFGLIRNPNPKVKVGMRPRAAHEVPLLQTIASRVVNMEETPTISTLTGTTSAMKKSPLDFADEDVQTDVVGEHQTDNPVSTTVPQQEQPAAESATTEVPPETNLEQEVLTMGHPVNKRHRKRDRGETGSNAPSKVLRTERGTAADTQSVSEPEPLSFALPRLTPEPDVAQSSRTTAVEDEDTEKSSSFTSMGGPPDDIYHPSWGITNRCRLDNPLVCQELVQDDKIKNLESLIEAESDMKRAEEAKNETLTKELEDLRAHISKLQVDSEQLTQQVTTLQAQVTGEEKIKAAFEEFKQLEDKRVKQRCADMDARLDSLSIDFDEELYPHMLTAITDVVTAGIAKGLSDRLRDGVEHGKAGLDLASLEGHDPEANEKFTVALQALKDLKYPLVDELEQLKDASIDCIMASLHLESDTGEDAPPEDAIAANISRAEKKKRSRVVCRTHGVGSAHHARSDGVPVFVPVVPQGLQIVLTDASTQTGVDKDNSPRRLTRASSVPLF
ncbi:hypothetical protein Tco_0548115 [Tanacetum coccineum]